MRVLFGANTVWLVNLTTVLYLIDQRTQTIIKEYGNLRLKFKLDDIWRSFGTY